MYLIAFDISKYKHDCVIMNEFGNVTTPWFTFNNDYEGFMLFKSVYDSLDHTQVIRIGLEATGHYGNNLKHFLTSIGLSYMEFNPILTDSFRKATSVRKRKTDKVDVEVIANMLRSFDYKETPPNDDFYQTLKDLTRYRTKISKQTAVEKTRLINILDKLFPEFTKILDPFSVTGTYVLTNYPNPKSILNADLKELFEILYKSSKHHFKLDRFQALIISAANTVGNYSSSYEFLLNETIENINTLTNQQKRVEKEITRLLEPINSPLLRIKGLGINTAAILIAEFQNFENFNYSKQVISFAGLDTSIKQSGTMNVIGKMTKRGSKYIRRAIIFTMMPLMNSQPKFKEYYQKKRKEGKKKTCAQTHLAKKFLRIIFHLVKNNLEFDPLLVK